MYIICCLVAILLGPPAAPSFAAGIKAVPSAARVSAGESFTVDVAVDNIPAEGLGAIQFRLNVEAQGSAVRGVSDISLGAPSTVSVAAPLIIGIPSQGRSGIGEFFYNAAGPNGILVMDNEEITNGSALYTFGHTSGSIPSQGGGSVARFSIGVGRDVTAERITIALTDVMLLDTGVMYPLDSNTGAVIELRCMAAVPNILGLSKSDAIAALQAAGLVAGNSYKIPNPGTYALNQVLAQSLAAGVSAPCGTPVDFAINTPPAEVGFAQAADKISDENGGVILSWSPSSSADTAGYRVYLISGAQGLLKEIRDPLSTGTEISGLPVGQSSQIRITAFDGFGNESSGIIISATAVDDVAPRITIGGVLDGAYYASAIVPAVQVEEAHLSSKETLLNGVVYTGAPITMDGAYTLSITARDTAGNVTTKHVSFVIDKTAPSIIVTGVDKGKSYNSDVIPVVSVSDSNPMSLEIALNGFSFASGSVVSAEGVYELKVSAVDRAGNRSEDTYGFTIDKTKPSSSIVTGEPKFIKSSSLFVSGSTTFTVIGNDAGVAASGIEKLEYRLNGTAWNTYQTPFSLTGTENGPVSIDCRAADKAGNVEDFHTHNVILDSIAPVTEISAGDPKYLAPNGTIYIAGSTNITLTSTDNLSGVAKTEYRIDGGAWAAYAPFTIPAEGTHTIGYRSMDNLGNAETEKTHTLIIDIAPPVTVITVGKPKFSSPGGKIYVSGSAQFSLSASDGLSGVSVTEFRIDGGQWNTYAVPFAVPSEGPHVIEYGSRDNVGNAETVNKLDVITDNTPPVTGLTFGGPKHVVADITYITKDTDITYSATDSLSGVSRTEYRVDDGAWTVYAPFRIESEGIHTVSWYSVDHVGNREETRTFTVTVDNTPPVTELSTGDPKYIDQAGNIYITKDSVFTLTATDNLSGVATTEYMLDDGPWTAYSPFAVTADGTHTIVFKSTDNIGNVEIERTAVVIVDNTPPATAMTVGDPKHSGTSLFVRGNTPFEPTSVDDASGIATIEFRLDGGAWKTVSAAITLGGEGILNDGPVSIEYRAIDHVGNTETSQSLSVVLDNTGPSVNAGPDIFVYAERDGRKSVTVDGSVSEPAGFDPSPKMTWSEDGVLIGQTEDLTYTFHRGRHDLTLKAEDHLGNVSSDNVRVTVMARQAALNYLGDIGCHWSDTASFKVNISDVTGGQAPTALAGYGNVTFRIVQDGFEKYRYSSGATDAEGNAQTSYLFFDPVMPAGMYKIIVDFSDPLGIYASASLEVQFTLSPENGALDYSGNQVVTVYDPGIQLRVAVNQEVNEADGRLIDFNNEANKVYVQFDIYKFSQTPGQVQPYFQSGPVRVVNSALHPDIGVAGYYVPLALLGTSEENYTVAVRFSDDAYITAYPDEATVTVYNPDGRFITGGGFITDTRTGLHNNFGFTFKYNKQGKPQGNLIYIIRDEIAGTKTRIKSNMIQSLGFPPGNPPGTPTAIAEGKCNVAVYDLLSDAYLGGVGNLTFSLYGEDRGLSGINEDTFRLEVRYPDGVPYEPGHMNQSEFLQGGNIVIHGPR